MRKPDVLICDDHAIFRNGLSNLLHDKVNLVGEAANGKECIELVKTVLPDIILLDIRMPEMNGIDCLRHIRRFNADVKVLAITQFDESRLVKQMMKSGANGYLLKDTTRDELLKAFAKVMDGKLYCTPRIDPSGFAKAEPKAGDKLFPDLSQREKQVLELICMEFSNKQIAAELGISIKTVELHRFKLFKKIGVSNLAGLVRWAVENNFLPS